MSRLAYVRQNPAEFADFNMPWSLNISFSYSFSTHFKSDYSGFETTINSNFNLNGDFNLTPKWKMGMNGYYDFNLLLYRRLPCLFPVKCTAGSCPSTLPGGFVPYF